MLREEWLLDRGPHPSRITQVDEGPGREIQKQGQPCTIPLWGAGGLGADPGSMSHMASEEGLTPTHPRFLVWSTVCVRGG